MNYRKQSLLPSAFLPHSVAPRRGGRSLSLLHRDLDELFNGALGSFWGTDTGNGEVTESSGQINLAFSLHEDPHAYTVRMEIPGVDEDSLDITFTDGRLTIHGEKHEDFERTENGRHVVQRSFGSFTKQVALEAPVNEEEIDAVTKSGVLTVTLPKAAEEVEKIRKVSVRSTQ